MQAGRRQVSLEPQECKFALWRCINRCRLLQSAGGVAAHGGVAAGAVARLPRKAGPATREASTPHSRTTSLTQRWRITESNRK